MTKVLISNVLAYVVPGKRELYLSVLGNKKHNVLVKKGVDKVLSELSLYEAFFKLRLEISGSEEDEVVAYVKNNNFPNPDEYYKVLNFDNASAPKLLLEAENEKGVFSGDFEVYLDETSKGASFICQEMSGYKEALDEMTRRFYTEVGKKTKKWIPGHRYDSIEGTYYYLGAYLARKKEEFNSTFITAMEDMTPVHIYTTKLCGEKTVSEVFKNQCYTDDELKVFWTDKLPSCVDSGAVLEDDSPSLNSLYLEMVENAISRPDITELKPVFDVLCYSSHLDPLCYPGELKEPILKVVHGLIEEIVLENWNKTRAREERCIGESIEPEKNVERIKYSFLLSGSIQDGNILERYYYEDLFNALGIDLDFEISEFLKTWDEKNLCSNFSEFCKYNSYFNDRTTPQKNTSIQRSGEKTVKISDLFGNGILCDTIKDLIKRADQNYGEGISSYRVIKMGKATTSISCTVTLDDILKLGDPSEELKNDIIQNRFSRVNVHFDKDKEIE